VFCPQKSKTTVLGDNGQGEPWFIQRRIAGICPLSDVTLWLKVHTNRGTSADAGVVAGAFFGQEGD